MGEKRQKPKGGSRLPAWKRGKQETGKLQIGSRGLLITHTQPKKYKEAMQECLTILREHCESSNPDFGRGRAGDNTANSAANVEEAIKLELEDSKAFFDRFVPGPNVSKNVDVVYFKNEADIPSKYIKEIFHANLKENTYSARFLCRMIPYDLVCKAEGEPFTEALTKLIAREFPNSQANGVLDTGRFIFDQYNTLLADNKDDSFTWCLSYTSRNSNALPRQDVLDLSVQLVGRNYSVDLHSPDKLIVVEVVKMPLRINRMPEDSTGEESAVDLVVPTDGIWVEHEDESEGGWYAHEGLQWLYNTRDRIYYHIETNTVVSAGAKGPYNLIGKNSSAGSTDAKPNNDHYSPVDSVQESSEDPDISIDFERDLRAATISRQGNSDQKDTCEDYYVTLECMSIHLVSRSEALCYYTGVFDGHCGYKCAEYLTKHLKNNILSVYRQAVRSTRQKKSEKDVPVDESAEVKALMQGCSKGFEMTDKNFCNIASNYHLWDGSTATISLIYGPDEEGCLKLITAHAGDSRALLCSMTESDQCLAQALTTDHKPNDAKERQYIEKNGGYVEFTQGAWRCISKGRNGQPTSGLATSRALGDYPLKHPNRIVSSEPDVCVYTINFDNDLFLVLVTDGITAVLTNQEIVDLVCEAIDEECSPDAAAERVVATAEQRGSLDDKTCTVIYFGWHRDLFDKCVRNKEADVQRQARETIELQQENAASDKEDDIFSN
ncbi:phosphatase 2C domain containing protein [Babesia ovis]|uniref:Phosphatase 2C domain containing protein n=1 Tax=Babesia ovis TaxID=5869 RepID=A0A9W5T9Y9_BABOV|nr:phosphatase 2C domain containing protein [Babesia ovis]